MSSERKQKLEEKINKSKVKNKELKYGYRLRNQHLEKINNRYVFIADAFSFTSNDEAASTVVFGFSNDGQLLWDNSFVHLRNDYFSMYQQNPLVYIHGNQDEVALIRKAKGNFLLKYLQAGQYNGRILEMVPPPKHESDQITQKIHRNFFGWYGNYILSATETDIVNQSNQNLNRKVFNLSKVEVIF